MKTLIIADIGLDHRGSSSRARTLIDEAKNSGCDAVKILTYITDKILSKNDNGYDLLKRNELSQMQQKSLKEYADDSGIAIITSPLDTDSLMFSVDELGVKKIKMSSFDLQNKQLLGAVNDCGKKNPALHVLISSGMAQNWLDVQYAMDCFTHVAYLTVMHCVTAYPAEQKEINLETIRTLKHLVHGSRTVGYSDHTDSIFIPAAAVLIGATVIQKQLVLDKSLAGVDSAIAADPTMMRAMVNLIRTYETILGNGEFSIKEAEKEFLGFRRIS